MTTPLKTRILIADDHPVVLRGLRNVLNAQPDLEVVAEATDGEQALQYALSEDLHLAILDISMPRMTGLQAAREITRRRPAPRDPQHLSPPHDRPAARPRDHPRAP